MINKIIVHCSASPQGRHDDAATIHRWHVNRGFDGIGYHYVVLENGNVQHGRPEYWQGAHAAGHNRDSLGICLIGQGGDATPEQLNALRGLITQARHKYGRHIDVIGHCDVNPAKTCPGFDVKTWLNE